MKHGYLTILIALSLAAIAFMPIVAADITPQNADYNVNMLGGKERNQVILTIYTDGKFDGNDADNIELIYYDVRNRETTITPNNIEKTTDTITIYLLMGREVFPAVSASHAVGFVDGETFYAAGPGWGWGNIH
jgi:hypothetical protein